MYLSGFVVPVPAGNEEPYLDLALAALPLFKEYGASRQVEAWDDDVPEGESTDLRRAVKAEDGEVVVFSWLEYPDRATCEESHRRMMEDPRMTEWPQPLPFSGARMIFGGFSVLHDTGPGEKPAYVDGALLPVAVADRDAYAALAGRQVAAIRDHGASRVVVGWGDYLPDGKETDFKGAVKADAGETVVFSFAEWPSKAVRDAAWQSLFADPRMAPQAGDPTIDESRRAFGGFRPILDA
jgi:Uncharacterized conserved protein